jgi:hypothetical protein
MSANNQGVSTWDEQCDSTLPLYITRDDPAFLLLLVLAAHPDLELDSNKMVELSRRIPSRHYWTSSTEINDNLYYLVNLARKLRELLPLMGNNFDSHTRNDQFQVLASAEPEAFEHDGAWAEEVDFTDALERQETVLTDPAAITTTTTTTTTSITRSSHNRNGESSPHAHDEDEYPIFLRQRTAAYGNTLIAACEPEVDIVDVLAARLRQERRYAPAAHEHSTMNHDDNNYEGSISSGGVAEDEVEIDSLFIDEQTSIHPPSPWILSRPSSPTIPSHDALFSDSYPHSTTFERSFFYSDLNLHENDNDDAASVVSIGGGVWMGE